MGQERDHLKICVFDGDGIGPEIMAPTLRVLDALRTRFALPEFQFEHHPAGASHYFKTGEDLPEPSVEAARAADAVLLSAMGDPAVRKPDGTELTPQIALRFRLGLFAGVRPVRIVPGQPTPLGDPRAAEVDFVLIRESTEGLFAHMNEGVVRQGVDATETLRITRETSQQLFDFTFRLARRRAERRGRPARVTCVDKANVFRAFWFFREIFQERARDYPDIATDAAYVDAMAMWIVQRPWEFDVMVTENMFGDILSDLGAGLMGSLGLAPSADIGDEAGVFQPCHGSAPDIAGQGIANPLAMILSSGMMLDWLSDRTGNPRLGDAAAALEQAVDRVVAEGSALTPDLGGSASTDDCAAAVLAALDP